MKKTGNTNKAENTGMTGSRRKRAVRGYAAALAAVVMLLAAGCGNGEKTAEAGEGTAAEAGGGIPLERDGGTIEADGQQAAGDTTGKGYVFTVNGVTMAIDAEAGPLTEQLGEPVSYFEGESCAFEGLDKIYTYSGFELYTYPKDGKDYVSAIVLTDDSVATAEGIAIGDSSEKLSQAYPGDGTEICGMLIYEKDDMKLVFIIQDGEIISIEYRTKILG